MTIVLVTFKAFHHSGQGIGWSGPHKRLFTLPDGLLEKTIREKVLRELQWEFDETEGRISTDKASGFELIISKPIL